MKKTIKKTTKRTTTAKKPVKRTTKKATTQSKLQIAQAKERKSTQKLNQCVREWDQKEKKAKTSTQRQKVNARYNVKFKKLDKQNTKNHLDVEIIKLQNQKKRLG